MSLKCPYKFICTKCDYKCNKKNVFEKHLKTIKHITPIISNNNMLKCPCGKIYKHRSSLYTHQLNCTNMMPIYNNPNDSNISSIDFLGSLSKLQNTIQEQNEIIQTLIPKIGNTTINNKISVNMYLNEYCKNAISIEDLTKSIRITHDDIYTSKKYGLLHNTQKLIIDKINGMEQTERPIHCTDAKRKTLYIKDSEGWTKEGSDEKIKNSISKIADDHFAYFIQHFPPPPISDTDATHKYSDYIGKVSQSVENDDKAMDKSVRTISEKFILRI